MPVTVGDEVGRIIGADPGTVVMHQNVSVCQSLVLSCFEPTPQRNKIVYSELNFPSVMYVYEAHARDGKLKIEVVKSDDGITVHWNGCLQPSMKRRCWFPSRVLFKSGFLQDAKAIVERARSRSDGRARHLSIRRHSALQCQSLTSTSRPADL